MVRTTVTEKVKALWRTTRITRRIAAIFAATLIASTPMAHAASATLNWATPTTNTDGTAFTDLAGYKVYVGTSAGSYQPGVSVGKVNSYTLSNLTDGSTYYFAVTALNSKGAESSYSNQATKTLAAAATSYSITATAGTGGTITATSNTSVSTASNGTSTITTATVTSGGSQAFSIAPASGYSISGVMVDGASVGAVSTYTFSNVTANHTISATFAATGTGTTGGTTTTASAAFAVNSGGPSYTDAAGITYATDANYSGGTVATNTATISGTSDQKLYQSERYGNFTYSTPLSNGNYSVTLKFAENYWTAAGKRVFSVAMNGATVISNLDLYAKVGKNVAYDVTVPVSVTNGTLSIAFTSQVNYAKVSAIKVVPASSTGSVLFAYNAGGANYIGSDKTTYLADTGYTGGTMASTTAAIAGTTDQPLYQTERYGNFSYSKAVPNGNYSVTLKFAENYWSATGKRVFNVAINGATVISNLDLYAKAGKNKAYDVTIPVSVTNGALNINFISQIDNAKVDAIIVKSS